MQIHEPEKQFMPSVEHFSYLVLLKPMGCWRITLLFKSFCALLQLGPAQIPSLIIKTYTQGTGI